MVTTGIAIDQLKQDSYDGILFSPAMVKAILAGVKTQTRRLGRRTVEDRSLFELPYSSRNLVVRETHYSYGHWQPMRNSQGELVQTEAGKQRYEFVAEAGCDCVFDVADIPKTYQVMFSRPRVGYTDLAWYKRLARFMPYKYARLLLEIQAISLEPLQEISLEDCLAEGIEVDEVDGHFEAIDYSHIGGKRFRLPAAEYSKHAVAKISYGTLWESINGYNSWLQNPTVWKITFSHRFTKDVPEWQQRQK